MFMPAFEKKKSAGGFLRMVSAESFDGLLL